MAIHYRIGSRIEREFLEIDGPHISVADLKKSIMRLKGIGKKGGVDLQIANDQTKEVYKDENTLIAKYSMVKVALVPAEKTKERPQYWTQARAKDRKEAAPSTPHIDLASLDIPEQEKIQAMMIQSTLDYHPSKYADIRHSKQTGPVPPHFRCHRCQQRGSHWVYNCPLGLEGKRVKRSTGIPRSFMNTVEGPWVPGAMMTPDGTYAVVAPAESLVVPPPTTAPPEMPPPAPDSTPSASKTRTKEAEKRIPIQRWDGQPRGPGKPSRSRYKPYRRRDLVQL